MADRPAGDEPIHFRVLRDTRHTDPTEYKHVRTLTKPIHVRPEGYEIVLNGEPRAVLTYEDKDDRDVITIGSGQELKAYADEQKWEHLRFRAGAYFTRADYAQVLEVRGGQEGFAIWERFANIQNPPVPVNPIVKGSELIVSDQAVRIAQPSAIPSGDDTVKAASKGNQTVTEEPSNLWEGYTSQLASIHADHDRVSRPVEDGETESQPTQRAMGQHAVTLEGNVRTSQSMQSLAAITFPDILAGIKTKLDRLSDELGREMGRLGITDGIHHQIPGAVDRVLEGVGSCVANVAETVQQASIMSRRAADATCRLNTSQLENAFSGAKGVIENLGGFLQSSIDRGFISEPQRELREAHAGAQAPRSVVPQVHQDPASLLDDPIPRFHSQTLAPASNGGEIQTTQITAALVEARGHSDGSRSFSRRQRPQTVGNHVTFARSHDASIPLRHPLRSAPRIASVNCGGPARGRCQIPGAWPPSAERTTAIPSVVQGSESPKVEQCTMQLLEMGFAGEAAAGIDQLRFFAKEADGDIEKAIDMLNEEQGCWSEMRQRHT